MITQEILILDVSHRALNFIALTNSTSEIELNTGREISYPQAIMYYLFII